MNKVNEWIRPGRYQWIVIILLSIFVFGCGTQRSDQIRKVYLPFTDHGPLQKGFTYPFSPSTNETYHTRWESFTNPTNISDMLIGRDGNIWTIGSGGVVRWDNRNRTYQAYTPADGLPDILITAIALDLQGKVWIGTYGGQILSFNGDHWSSIAGLDPMPITGIAFSPDGTMWVGTSNGIYSSTNSTWNGYTTEQGLLDNYIHSIYVTSTGTLWVGTIDGASFFDGKKWHSKFISLGGMISDIAEAPDHKIWFGSENSLVVYDGVNWSEIACAQEPGFGIIESIVFTPDGAAWFGSSGGLFLFDNNFRELTRYEIEKPSTVQLDADGSLWIGSHTQKFFHLRGEVYDSHPASQGLLSNYVTAGALGTDGSLWFSTGIGITCFDGVEWQSFTTKDGLLNNAAESISTSPDGSVWFQMDRGISRWDGEKWRTYPIGNDILDRPLTSLGATTDNSVWYLNYRGLVRFDGVNWNIYPVPFSLPSNPFEGHPRLSMAIGPDQSIWIGTLDRKLFRYHQETWTSIPSPIEDTITSVLLSKNNDI